MKNKYRKNQEKLLVKMLLKKLELMVNMQR